VSDFINKCLIGDCRDSMHMMIDTGMKVQIYVTIPQMITPLHSSPYRRRYPVIPQTPMEKRA